jgi:tartrate-resistant acid phosphatase type 5
MATSGTRGAPGDRHREPFVHLVDVTDRGALVGWGAFFFERSGPGWRLVPSEELDGPDRPGGETIGARSAPFGEGCVEVLGETDDAVVARARTTETNHVWVDGLEPDTRYRYRLTVDGEPWADELMEWHGGTRADAGLRPSSRRYDLRFTTHPAPDARRPLTFLLLSDYGVGIRGGAAGLRQQGVANALEDLARRHPVRLVLTAGDNIYHGPAGPDDHSGNHDDDWYFTFYEPYRFLIDHLPVYPAVGNHDTGDTERSDDRDQLADNFHLEQRFAAAQEEGRASCEPGLYYRIPFGSEIELVCIDTSYEDAATGRHFFDDPKHAAWLDDTFPPEGDPRATIPWRIPFCHHPPWCAGPKHDNMRSQIERLVPRYQRSGVPLLLCGHEHNFQFGTVEGLPYVIAGAAGKLREGQPRDLVRAGTEAFAVEGHCLLVEIDLEGGGSGSAAVTAFGACARGEPAAPIALCGPSGATVSQPLRVQPRLGATIKL